MIRWTPEKDALLMEELAKIWGGALLFGASGSNKGPRPDKNVKLAWVMVGEDRVMLGVDNQTMVGYAMDETTPVWKIPLEKVEYDEFVRWCTTFDL